MMNNTKTVAMPIVLTDAKMIEAIAYNISATAQIQPSMSEPADVSLPLPSLDLLLMDTKMAVVSTAVIDAKTIEAIIHNIAATAQIQNVRACRCLTSVALLRSVADGHQDGGYVDCGHRCQDD
jgi:hypothetical protein